MNKWIKGCLITLVFFLLIIGGIVFMVYHNISHSTENNERDDRECAAKMVISDQPVITIKDSISTKNVTSVKLFVLENNKIVDSATVKNQMADRIEINLPFKNISLKSKIEIKTNETTFVLDSMYYFNDAHWGMFGYLGENCQLNYTIKKSLK